MFKSRRLRWTGHVAIMKEVKSALKILTGKPTGMGPPRRPRCRWDLKERGVNMRNCIDFTQDWEY